MKSTEQELHRLYRWIRQEGAPLHRIPCEKCGDEGADTVQPIVGSLDGAE